MPQSPTLKCWTDTPYAQLCPVRFSFPATDFTPIFLDYHIILDIWLYTPSVVSPINWGEITYFFSLSLVLLKYYRLSLNRYLDIIVQLFLLSTEVITQHERGGSCKHQMAIKTHEFLWWDLPSDVNVQYPSGVPAHWFTAPNTSWSRVIKMGSAFQGFRCTAHNRVQ